MEASSPRLAVERWGLVPYAEAVRRQLERVAARRAGTIGDTLVLVEHPPVYTLGARRGADAHVVWDEPTRAAAGIELHQASRGGDVTYHGPGQLVGYPILDLSAERDLHAYLRRLEEVLIRALAASGLAATRRPGLTGIWCEDRKIAAIGVAVKSWVTYHGFALNLDPDLTHFGGIVPCGITASEGGITSMARELGRPPVWPAVEAHLVRAFHEVFFPTRSEAG